MGALRRAPSGRQVPRGPQLVIRGVRVDVPTRYDGAEDEGAEHRVQPHRVGGPGGQQQSAEDHPVDQRAVPVPGPFGRQQPAQAGPDHVHHAEDEEGGQHGHPGQRPGAGVIHHHDHDGEHGPRQQVLQGSAGERRLPDALPGQTVVGEDADQHRKGCDGHGRPEEQRRADQPGPLLLREGPGREHEGQTRAQRERQGNGAERDRHYVASLAAQISEVQVIAHLEHEDNEAQLGQYLQKWPGLGREQDRGRISGEQTQQARSQHQSRGYLPQHRRLPQPLGDPAAQQRRGHHHGKADKHLPNGSIRRATTDQHDPSPITGPPQFRGANGRTEMPTSTCERGFGAAVCTMPT